MSPTVVIMPAHPEGNRSSSSHGGHVLSTGLQDKARQTQPKGKYLPAPTPTVETTTVIPVHEMWTYKIGLRKSISRLQETKGSGKI